MRTRSIINLLMMFGPMILRQYQKYQRKKEKKQGWATPDKTLSKAPQGEYIEHEPVKPQTTKMSEEEKLFNLEEEDIMLDNEDLRNVD